MTYSNLVARLTRKTVAGEPVFPTPIELEAADAIEALERKLESLAAELDMLKRNAADATEYVLANVNKELEAAHDAAWEVVKELRELLRETFALWGRVAAALGEKHE